MNKNVFFKIITKPRLECVTVICLILSLEYFSGQSKMHYCIRQHFNIIRSLIATPISWAKPWTGLVSSENGLVSSGAVRHYPGPYQIRILRKSMLFLKKLSSVLTY